MKNKLINFSKNIFKGILISIKDFSIVILIFSILLFIFFGATCGVGFIITLIMQNNEITLANLIDFGMAFISISVFSIGLIYFIASALINFIKWIINCWKNS